MVRLLIGTDPQQTVFAQKVVLFQAALFSIAAAIALWSSYSWHKSIPALISSLILITLSPLSIAWPRWVLTETLAAAAGLLVFAALFCSFAAQRMKVIKTGIAIALAIFLRWDQIWLLVPAFLCAFYLGGYSRGLRHTVTIGLIAIFPILAMIGRAGLVGIPLLPNNSITSDPYLAKGVWVFFQKTALTQDATSGFLWSMWDRRYEELNRVFNYDSIFSSYDTVRFRSLTDRISALPNGSPLPADIDAELVDLAGASKKLGIGLTLNFTFQRAIKMWTAMDTIFYSGWMQLPSAKTVETFSFAYRILLIITCILLLLRARGVEFVLLVGLICYIAFRTFFFASLTMLEIRYLMPMFPVMEVALVSLAVRGRKQARNDQLRNNC